jgi:hypothetical protein
MIKNQLNKYIKFYLNKIAYILSFFMKDKTTFKLYSLKKNNIILKYELYSSLKFKYIKNPFFEINYEDYIKEERDIDTIFPLELVSLQLIIATKDNEELILIEIERNKYEDYLEFYQIIKNCIEDTIDRKNKEYFLVYLLINKI